MSYEKVTEHVYAITDGSTRGNVCAFELPSQIIFIDSGMNIPKVKKFREKLEKETGKKTTKLLITHVHGDHIYGNMVFKDCEIISHKDTRNRMVNSLKTQWTPEKLAEMIKNVEDPSSLEGLEIILPTKTFEFKNELEDYDTKIIHKNTGGHTAGSSYVYFPAAKALAAGDNLFVNMFPWAGDESANPQKWIDALREYLTLDVEYFIPGHGPVCTKVEVKEWLDYLEKAVVLIRKLITQGFSEANIIEKVNQLEYYEPRRQEWKDNSIKKWYQVLAMK
ncbi:MAG: MBL fold metallo-hydrolase [Asgard group archaeon]|nr:MBL fold metallo-hydrolase [Asgard group archaeon]